MMSNNYKNRRSNKRQAFTLVEILVALGIMMILMVIILVPINMALNVFHIGKARNELQQANKIVLGQLASELRQAVHVFPNEQMPGITDKSPYTLNSNFPYYQLGTPPIPGTPTRVSNTSRLDFLLPARTSSGTVSTPLTSTNYIVTYYARRLDVTKDYDEYSNPIVLFRVQYPHKNDNGTAFNSTAPFYNASNSNITSSRYPISSAPYAGQVWLTQSKYEEPDLSTLWDHSGTVAGSHTLITPRDMGLFSPSSSVSGTSKARLTISNPTHADASLKPDSSFTCDDINTDGKIDRVTINLHLVKYDSIGANPNSQKLRLTQTVDLPNVK